MFLALLIGVLLGFGICMVLAAGNKPSDWSGLLVIITAIYVVLTFLLLRTSTRQAAAAEDNSRLLRQQLSADTYRRSGPIVVLAHDIKNNLNVWERALRKKGDLTALPPLLPEDFEGVRSLSATIDVYYHQELTRVRTLTSRAATAISGITTGAESSETVDSAIAKAQSDLRAVRRCLKQVLSNIYGWDEDQQQ